MNMKQTLIADNLSPLSHISHAFFTRAWGNGGFSGQENNDNVYKTRAAMAEHLHIAPQNLISCYQIHSPDVITVTEIWSGDDRPRADAMVTNKTDIALGILTADCVPVLFADDKNKVIGAAHAGWRGAIGGVLENTLAAMEKLGAQKRSIHTALGPCIWQNSYEVSADFLAPFVAEDTDSEKFFRPSSRNDHFMFNLPAYVEAKLRKLGVGSVAASPADTCAAPDRFYSHRYSTLRDEKRAGNLMSAIALKGANL